MTETVAAPAAVQARTPMPPIMAAPPAASAAPRSRMSLAAVTRGRVPTPFRVLLYGPEGIGKTTFAAGAPSPIFFDLEDGSGRLDVARFEAARTFGDLIAGVDELIAADHDFKTAVFDTVDALEALIWAVVIERHKYKTIGDDFGKGYDAAVDVARQLISRLERLQRVKGMGLILVGHSKVKPFKNPEGPDYDRYTVKLHEKLGSFLKEWCDTVLFAQQEVFTKIDKSTKRAKGVSSGVNVIRTSRTAAYDAKNRDHLPESLPLDWSAYADAVAAQAPASPDDLLAEIAGMLAQVPADKRAAVDAAVAKAGRAPDALVRTLNRIRATVKAAAESESAE